ncbi:ABC transporter substrate-binding protein [Sanguibacter sp. 25GB23B1]|uniref:ABC transporter substrate-binding protein n=1 Tax=unclassified Sanguibacter TaxID=2645534 RepID=UPI0032AE8EFA
MTAFGVAGLLLLTTTTACGGGSDDAGSGSAGGTGSLVLGQSGIPISYDVQGYASGQQTQYFTAVFDTLLRQDGEGEIVPGIATEWSYDDTRTVLTLTLTEGITFTDGVALDADAVVANIEHFRSSSTPDLSNAAFVAGVAATDPTHVVITLSQPDPMMLNWLTQPLGYMSSPDSWDNPDVATNPVGSGPYVLDAEATVVGSTYEFDKNPDYWDESFERYDTLTMNYYADQSALLNALQGGQVDAASFSNFSSLEQVESAGYDVNTAQLDWEGLMLLDRDGSVAPELADVRVRQAINYAIDKEGILSAILLDHGSPTSQIFGPATDGYVEELDSAYAFDPDKARDLLAEAGYADGIELSMPTAAGIDSSMLTQVQQQLADVGITVSYTDVGTNLISDIMGAKYPATWFRLASASDWQTATFAITPDALFNSFKTTTPEVAELLVTLQTGTEDEAATAAQDLNRYIVEEAWFAPFYFVDNIYVSKPTVDVTMAADMVVPYIYLIQPAA